MVNLKRNFLKGKKIEFENSGKYMKTNTSVFVSVRYKPQKGSNG